MFLKIYNDKPKKSISLKKFIRDWKFWDYNDCIPNLHSDVIEFAYFLFESVSESFQKMFSFRIKEFDDPDFYMAFVLNCLKTNGDIQNRIINHDF